tara:strand:+ start:252 stop:986 length:735 start_codon:yes stop_codon:yes gene_type:complete
MEEYENQKARYEFFLRGELIDLCIPSDIAIEEDGWADWFNNIELLQATAHGVFPNHRSSQHKILESLASDRSKIVLLICEKVSQKAFGVVSLENINLQNRSAQIAINASSKSNDAIHPLSTLEAMALITQHGFDQLGLNRIYGGQAFPLLESWNKAIELIGYRTEGITRNSFVRGHNAFDTALISCSYEHFLSITKIRGSLWGSSKEIRKTMRRQPKTSFANLLSDQLKPLEDDYFRFLFSDVE